jgi:hypothetical protein
MPVHEALDPLRPIAHRTHRPRRLGSAPVRLHQRQVPKALRLGQTRDIGELRRLDQPRPPLPHRGLDRPDRQDLDLRPLLVRPGDHGPIHAEPLDPGPRGRRRQVPLDGLHSRRLDRLIRRAGGLGRPPQRRRGERYTGEEGLGFGCLRKGHSSAQADQALGPPGAAGRATTPTLHRGGNNPTRQVGHTT